MRFNFIWNNIVVPSEMVLLMVISFLEICVQNNILANSDSISKTFTALDGKRFTLPFDSVATESQIDCCIRCVSREGCLSVNFENSTKQCQFVALPYLATQLHIGTEVSSSWDIYATDGMLCLFEPRREKTGFLHMRKQRRRSENKDADPRS